MNTISAGISEASMPACTSGTDSCVDHIKTEYEDVRNSREGSYDNYCNGSPLGRSRYGRTIKLKCAEDNVVNSTQNSRMPKTRREHNSTTSSNESLHNNDVDSNVEEPNDSSVTLNDTEEDQSSKTSSPSIDCPWVVGQLAWARVGNFPFWPCVVTLDPVLMIYHKLKATARSHILMIHVQYFGDKGRHSWVSANCMMQFTNLEDFKKLAESLPTDLKKKEPKYVAAFIVKQGIRSKWESAIEEAMEVQPMTIEERAQAFAPKVKATRYRKSSTVDEKNKNNKRKYSFDEDGPNSKRAKHDNAINNIEKLYKSEVMRSRSSRFITNGRYEGRLSSDAIPSSPSHRISQSENSASAKICRSEEEENGVFEIYYERNKEMLEEEYPDATEHDIKKYLRKTWDSMDSAFRKKYRTYMTRDNSVHSKESSSDHDDDVSVDTDTSLKESRRTRSKVDRDEGSTSETKRSRPYNLFKGLKQEKVCQICEKTGKLTRCKGPCYSYFHLSCVKPSESSPEHSTDDNASEDKILNDVNVIKKSIKSEDENNSKMEEQEDETFKCIDCLSGVAPACFICNEREGDRIRCTVLACGKHYHSKCLKSWPQSHWQGGRLTCPYHLCHTCSSDNPQDNHSRAPNEKIARCVRCPSSYHASTSCLPAGSLILTGSQIVCPKHYKAPYPPLNAAWCFLCTRGGSLICCDTCPTSFHLECLGIDAPDGGFICEDCETGRLPLYGEIVWVKLGHYRWWPSRICYPSEIPEKVETIPHSPGNFCVMFLGSNDYYWVHRGRAFLYQDGDANIKPPIGKKTIMDDTYRKALEEANRIHLQLKAERSITKEPKGLKPPPYVKLKVNKPVGNVKPTEVESIVACECDPVWDNPCAPGTDCLNRILLVECSAGTCPAGSKCMNQSFVLRQYPAMEPFHTTGRGWGLRTLEDIKFGQFIIEYVGEVIDEAEYKRRLYRKKELKNENFYFLTIDNNRTIDAEPKGNLSRFMNHSCAPNCETQKWTVNGDTRIGLFALRDIESGEELTFNYNLASDGETRKPCLCGAPNCSGFIGLKAQKQQLPVSAMQPIIQPAIVQPRPLVQPKKVDKIDKLKRNKKLRKLLCWRCGQEITSANKLMVCEQRTCNKKYHRTCVDIDDTESRFSCPWHRCLECGRRTSAHCLFCSTAFCQVHFDGNLFEDNDKGGVVCKLHLNEESVEDDKEYSDNETDREYSSTSSDSPIAMEKITAREPSPRVAIVEVHLSSEESEESQVEEEENNLQTNVTSNDKISSATKKKTFNRLSLKSQREEIQVEELNNLTSSQLEAIIGGSLCE